VANRSDVSYLPPMASRTTPGRFTAMIADLLWSEHDGQVLVAVAA
jgi:hypothetical protein